MIYSRRLKDYLVESVYIYRKCHRAQNKHPCIPCTFLHLLLLFLKTDVDFRAYRLTRHVRFDHEISVIHLLGSSSHYILPISRSVSSFFLPAFFEYFRTCKAFYFSPILFCSYYYILHAVCGQLNPADVEVTRVCITFDYGSHFE